MDIELSKRLVACKQWRWMPGMLGIEDLAVPEPRVARRTEAGWTQTAGQHWRMPWSPDERWLPDLADPATLGCLFALVREVWKDPAMSVTCTFDHPSRGQRWYCWPSAAGPACRTEAEALVGALEAKDAKDEKESR